MGNKKRHTLPFPHKPAHFKKYGEKIKLSAILLSQKLLSGRNSCWSASPPAESLEGEGGGLEGEGLSEESPSPSNLSFIQRPHHLFRSNGLHTRMVAITVLLAVQRTGATIQLRLKNPILRPRREKAPFFRRGPKQRQNGRADRPREMHRAGISRDQ